MPRTFLRNESGAAAIEFGLIAPILVMLLLSIGIFGGLVIAYNKMSQGVSTGAQYVMTAGAADTDAVRDVVLAAWDDRPDNATVSVVNTCVCGEVVSDCDALCEADDNYPEKVTNIEASMTYSDLGGGQRSISATQLVRTW